MGAALPGAPGAAASSCPQLGQNWTLGLTWVPHLWQNMTGNDSTGRGFKKPLAHPARTRPDQDVHAPVSGPDAGTVCYHLFRM